jgi:hypothetical protein
LAFFGQLRNAGDGGTLGPLTVEAGAEGTSYLIFEQRGDNVTLDDLAGYDRTISCVEDDTDDDVDNPAVVNLDGSNTSLEVHPQEDWTCTITNVRRNDTSPPGVEPVVVGTLGAGGFYRSDVSVSWTVEDPESAITALTGCGPRTVTVDTPGVTFTCFAASAGGTTTRSVVVKRDTVAPTLTLPLALTVDATRPAGATVTYAVSATDAIDDAPTVGCTPGTGATFPIGTTTVGCSAVDDAGGTSVGQFVVTVRGAATQIARLVDKTLAYIDARPLEASLKAILNAAIATLVANNRTAACRGLNLYLAAVGAAPSRQLTTVEKTDLRRDANRIRAVIGCP